MPLLLRTSPPDRYATGAQGQSLPTLVQRDPKRCDAWIGVLTRNHRLVPGDPALCPAGLSPAALHTGCATRYPISPDEPTPTDVPPTPTPALHTHLTPPGECLTPAPALLLPPLVCRCCRPRPVPHPPPWCLWTAPHCVLGPDHGRVLAPHTRRSRILRRTPGTCRFLPPSLKWPLRRANILYNNCTNTGSFPQTRHIQEHNTIGTHFIIVEMAPDLLCQISTSAAVPRRERTHPNDITTTFP